MNQVDNAYVTPRELEVVRLLSTGLNTKQVALELRLSQWTIYNHISHLVKKFNSNRYDLVYRMSLRGLIK